MALRVRGQAMVAMVSMGLSCTFARCKSTEIDAREGVNVDARRRTDLERLARLRGRALDRAFVQVMTARTRTASRRAANEARAGGLHEVRAGPADETELQTQLQQLTALLGA